MKIEVVKFAIIFIITYLMIYFLNKDYTLNWKSKKVFTQSRYAQIAKILGIANIIVTTSLLDKIHEEMFQSYFSQVINSYISWIAIPLICIIIFLSVFYMTYYQFMFKKNNNIKDK